MFRNIPHVNRFQIPEAPKFLSYMAVTFFAFAHSSSQDEIDVLLACK